MRSSFARLSLLLLMLAILAPRAWRLGPATRMGRAPSLSSPAAKPLRSVRPTPPIEEGHRFAEFAFDPHDRDEDDHDPGSPLPGALDPGPDPGLGRHIPPDFRSPLIPSRPTTRLRC